jgi:hypothetical protein
MAEPNGYQPVLVDSELERWLVAAVLADPARLQRLDSFAAAELGDALTRAAFSAIRNVVALGEPVTVAAVRARLASEIILKDPDPDRRINEHPQLGDLAWFDRIVSAPLPAGELPIVGWSHQLSKLAQERAALVEASEAAERAYDEDTARALDDVEPPVPEAPPTPKARWIVPLESFLGDEEPDDDDSTDWIIRDIIPRGEAGLIAGPPKCGKTWAMLDLGIDVALGRDWIETFANTMGGPAKVLALAFEDGQRRLRKRVWELARRKGLTPNDATLRAHLSVGREPLSLPGDERAFAAELKAWKPDLVLIDNLTRVMNGDQNAIKDAKRFGDMWCKLCTDVGAAVVFLHHTNKVGPIAPGKRSEGDPFELIRGSGDLVASARHLVLMRPLESPDATKLSDVRMRGNLDLRREDLVLEFERVQFMNRWQARLSHRGEGEAVRDELAAKRREKQAERKAGRVATRDGDGANSVDERVYATIVSLVSGGARDLCTLEQLKTSCNVRRQEVRPALDRLIHAGRLRTDSVRRHEGGSWRTRAIFVPTEVGG